MKYALIVLMLAACSPLTVAEQNKQIIQHKKMCTDAGLDFTIGTNFLTGERDAYCIKKGDRTP